MARPLRIDRAGGWYHVTARGNERRAIYLEDADRRHFCELLEEMVSRFGVRLHAYVLMDNHYHLIVEVTEPNLSRAAQWLNVSYSVWFNRKRGRSGHMFQGRFKSVVVDPVAWGLALSRYVHLNPVRLGQLGLGKTDRQKMQVGASGVPEAKRVQQRLSRLRNYRWSSYRAYVGLSPAPRWLECQAVLELGGEEFVRQLRRHVKGDSQEQRAARRLASARPALQEVIRCVERVKGEKWMEFRDRHGDSGRDLVLYLGRRACGWKLKELANAVGVTDYAAVAMAVKRFEKGLGENKTDREQKKRVCQMLNVQM